MNQPARGYCVRFKRVGAQVEYTVEACDVVRRDEPNDTRKWWTLDGRPAYKTVKQAHRGASLVVASWAS